MGLWIFSAEANHRLVIRTAIDYFQRHFIAQRMANGWKPPPIVIRGTSLPIRDFVSWMMSAPVISEKACRALAPLIREHCEILPLTKLRNKTYYAVNVLTTIDCLDVESSDI